MRELRKTLLCWSAIEAYRAELTVRFRLEAPVPAESALPARITRFIYLTVESLRSIPPAFNVGRCFVTIRGQGMKRT